MGYWETNEQGHSFSPAEHSDTEMIWGDAPADIMDDALRGIIAAFRSDLGRAPTLAELKAGLLFSAQSALDEDEERRAKANLYTYEVTERWTWTPLDAGLPGSAEVFSYFDATSVEDAQAQYEADRDPDFDARTGTTRELLSIEQIEETRTHKARGTLTVVKDEG